MRNRRPPIEHQEAVSRRLALLSQELASMAPPEPPVPDDPEPPPPPPPAGDHTRVRLRPVLTPDRPPDAWAAPEVPVPTLPPVPETGRHAARRPARPLLPGVLAERLTLGPTQLLVVALVVALGLAFTAWRVARAEPSTVAAPAVGDVLPADALASPTGAASPSAVADDVTVDVAGAVRRPGIVVLDAGSRVVDALEAAGGARKGVDLGTLNLARVLVDGEQVLVGGPAPAGTGSTAPAPGAPGAPVGLVNLNTAGQPELEALPEVGPVTAQAILAWRSENGWFSSVAQLLDVDGIGEATLATLTPLVTV